MGAWVLAFKHGSRPDLAPPLARHLAVTLARAAPDLMERARAPGRTIELCPVPLHWLRRYERGYDQAALLARGLGDALNLPVRRRLVRTRATPPQGSAEAAARATNVARAFRYRWGARARRRRPLSGRDVWLIDDVMTSGATADACARELARAGARSITVVVLARAGAPLDP